ncbi:unnamed protein product [Pieris macdunnoughi]|uniref:Uncharacterized protein n=1 Tax=Pieris macdunnoughi TaxID=345717 RepID=A0A821QG62_9NEOP|nr:unnamed protein product [Pieris macdunnoughi]
MYEQRRVFLRCGAQGIHSEPAILLLRSQSFRISLQLYVVRFAWDTHASTFLMDSNQAPAMIGISLESYPVPHVSLDLLANGDFSADLQVVRWRFRTRRYLEYGRDSG